MTDEGLKTTRGFGTTEGEFEIAGEEFGMTRGGLATTGRGLTLPGEGLRMLAGGLG